MSGSSFLSFTLPDELVDRYADRPIAWGFPVGGGLSLGELAFVTKYSRIKPDGTKERWHEVCRRVVEGTYSILKDHCLERRTPWNEAKALRSAAEMYDRMFTFKWLPPGRGLWMMGTRFVHEQRNAAALQNCAMIGTGTRGVPAAAARLMEMSMLGVGVGFDDLAAADSQVIQQPDDGGTWRIPDTREGWCDSTRLLLEAYLVPGTRRLRYDYTGIRPAGSPIRGFGGVAAGPEPLIELHESLDRMFAGRAGQRLTSVDVGDVMNMIGRCVVAGNVRRSAEIWLGSPNDKAFLESKNPELFPERNAPETGWAWASNNSVIAQVGETYDHIIDGIVANGEPGLVWLDMCRAYGRLVDPPNNRDYRVAGINPCVTGDTLVAVADGRNAVPIAQLAEEGYTGPVYAIVDGPRGKQVGVRKCNRAWKTRSNAEVFRVTLDDGSHVDATGDHRFMLRSGEYREAAKLRAGDSLMPWNSTRVTSGWGTDYRLIRSNVGLDLRQHKHIAAYYGIVGEHIHHVDGDSLNDRPDNLIGIDSTAHLSEHMRANNPMHDPAVAARVSATLRDGRQAGERNGHYGHRHTADAKAAIGVKSRANWERQRDVMRTRIREAMARREHDGRVDATCGDCGRNARPHPSHVGPDGDWTCSRCRRKVRNHQVVSVELIGRADVYDLEVEDAHNFAVITRRDDEHAITSTGVFIHNCGEQPLEDGEMCTLVNTYPTRANGLQDFLRTLKFAYLYGKAVTLFGTHWEDTNEIMRRNHRIGTSMSGKAQFAERHGWATLRQWEDEGYAEIRRWDRVYSEWLGVRESIKVTTVKPDGTTPLLVGTTSGCGWPVDGGHYLRRMRFGVDEPIVPRLEAAGFPIETDVTDSRRVVVELPVRGLGMRGEREVTIWEKAELAALAQRHWSDNAVSTTLSFREDEADQLSAVLHAFDGRLKTASFLPLTEAGAYPQMPQESIDVAEFQRRHQVVRPVDTDALYAPGAVDAVGTKFCDGDQCEVDLPE